jgi:hypothetical protein
VSCESSEFLLHAILAISSQHLAKKKNSVVLAAEMQNHQAIALRLFAEALSHTPASTLLDTLLLLVNFEVCCASSKPSRELNRDAGNADCIKLMDHTHPWSSEAA